MSKAKAKVLVGIGNRRNGFSISNDNYRIHFGWSGNYTVKDKVDGSELVTISSKENEIFHTKKILAIYGFELVDYNVLSNNEEFMEFFKDVDADVSITAKGKLYMNGENVPKQYIQHRFKVIINF